jgi:drug/metabolite transporter (DMT)-like permease
VSPVVMASICGVIFLLAWGRVLVHALGRSVGTAALVLAMPLYVFVYAFTQFEHRWKGWIASALVAFAVLTLVFAGLTTVEEPATEPVPEEIAS